MSRAIQEYSQSDFHSKTEDASPHRIVQLLLEGALKRMLEAKSADERGDVKEKHEKIHSAQNIIIALRVHLNEDASAEFVSNLVDVYKFVEKQLFMSVMEGDVKRIDKAFEVLSELKSDWDAIGDNAMDALREELSKK